MKRIWQLFALLIVGLIVSSCSTGSSSKQSSVAGSITIAVDESLRPIMEAEVSAFEGIYKDAHITVKYLSESEAITALVNDSAIVAITTRKLTDDEKAPILAVKTTPREEVFAKDGLALILHPDNKVSFLTWDQMKQILEGKITTWKQIDPKGSADSIQVIVDHSESSTVRVLKDSIAAVTKLPANFYAVNSSKAVVEYVAQHNSTLGVIGVSWISDEDDANANKFLQSVKVASVSRDGDYYQPFLAYLASKDYPIRRDVFLISRDPGAGLASGFTRFLTNEKGQRIVLKAGLVPAKMPLRLVEVNRKPLQ